MQAWRRLREDDPPWIRRLATGSWTARTSNVRHARVTSTVREHTHLRSDDVVHVHVHAWSPTCFFRHTSPGTARSSRRCGSVRVGAFLGKLPSTLHRPFVVHVVRIEDVLRIASKPSRHESASKRQDDVRTDESTAPGATVWGSRVGFGGLAQRAQRTSGLSYGPRRGTHGFGRGYRIGSTGPRYRSSNPFRIDTILGSSGEGDRGGTRSEPPRARVPSRTTGSRCLACPAFLVGSRGTGSGSTGGRKIPGRLASSTTTHDDGCVGTSRTQMQADVSLLHERSCQGGARPERTAPRSNEGRSGKVTPPTNRRRTDRHRHHHRLAR